MKVINAIILTIAGITTVSASTIEQNENNTKIIFDEEGRELDSEWVDFPRYSLPIEHPAAVCGGIPRTQCRRNSLCGWNAEKSYCGALKAERACFFYRTERGCRSKSHCRWSTEKNGPGFCSFINPKDRTRQPARDAVDCSRKSASDCRSAGFCAWNVEQERCGFFEVERPCFNYQRRGCNRAATHCEWNQLFDICDYLTEVR